MGSSSKKWPWAKYLGWQMAVFGFEGLHLYNVMTGEHSGTTVTEGGLRKRKVKAIYFPGAVIFLT